MQEMVQNTRVLEAMQKVESLDFTYIFETYYKRVYNYNYYRTHNQCVSEDLTSQAFEKVFTKLHTYTVDKGKFEVWLFTIVRNTMNDYYRSRKRYPWEPLEHIFETISKDKDPECIILEMEQQTEILKAIIKLNERERNIIAYKYGGNLSNKEIAILMNLNEKHVSVILFRALKKIKTRLEEENYESYKQKECR